MFGRATITLGIGPHSSFYKDFIITGVARIFVRAMIDDIVFYTVCTILDVTGYSEYTQPLFHTVT